MSSEIRCTEVLRTKKFSIPVEVLDDGNGGEWVLPQLTCKWVEAAWEPQRRRLWRSKWATPTKMVVVDSGGKMREQIVIPWKKFGMFVATIDASLVREDLRPFWEQLQEEAADAVQERFENKPVSSIAVSTDPLEMVALILQHAQAEKRRLDAVEHRVEKIEHKEIVALERSKSLPEAKIEAPPKSPCDLTEQRIRFYCTGNNLDHEGYRITWGRQYEEFRRRCHIDAPARFRMAAKGKFKQILDVVRELNIDLQEAFYAIACEMFPLGPMATGT